MIMFIYKNFSDFEKYSNKYIKFAYFEKKL